tara:strand:- start:200 stop:538 length:339 start_codon:yes stop_codon:yes gene_type:complete
MITSEPMVSVLINKTDAEIVRKVHDQLDTNNGCRDFVEELFEQLNDLDDGEMVNHFKIFFENWKNGSCSWNSQKILENHLDPDERHKFKETYKSINWNENRVLTDLMSKLCV